MIHLDTSCLIDLLRETTRSRPGPALDLIEELDAEEPLAASVHVVRELRAGAELAKSALKEHEELDRLLSGLVIPYPDSRFPAAYGRILAAVQRTGRPIAAMDLMIATAAMIDDAPLVTRNVKDCSRVPRLRVLGC